MSKNIVEGLLASIFNNHDGGSMHKRWNSWIGLDDVSDAFTKHYRIGLLYMNTTEVAEYYGEIMCGNCAPVWISSLTVLVLQ